VVAAEGTITGTAMQATTVAALGIASAMAPTAAAAPAITTSTAATAVMPAPKAATARASWKQTQW
jgi:hypothetical protein